MRKYISQFFMVIILLSFVSCGGRSEAVYFDNEEYESNTPNKTFAGIWHGFLGVPAGYSDRYYFNEDGTFIFIVSDMDGESRLRAFSGSWENANDQILLTTKNQIELFGGTLYPARGSIGTAYHIVGGTLVYTALAEEDFEVQPYEISDVFFVNFFYPRVEAAPDEYNEENFQMRSVYINGQQFWAMGFQDMFDFYFEQSVHHGNR